MKELTEERDGIVIYHIPSKFQEGAYLLPELNAEGQSSIDLQYYPNYGNILQYSENNRIYGISREQVESTLKAKYVENGMLSRITVTQEEVEKLVYICFSDEAEARTAVRETALEIAEGLSQQILPAAEPLERLFVVFFTDGQYVDIHAIPITGEQCAAKQKEYPQYPNIADNAGDFEEYAVKMPAQCDYLNGVINGAAEYGADEMFRFAVDTVTDELKENLLPRIPRTAGFRLVTQEYD